MNTKPLAPTHLHAIEDGHVRMLETVMKRLYTEMRMNGDEMRDAAHAIRAVVDYAKSFNLDEELAKEAGR